MKKLLSFNPGLGVMLKEIAVLFGILVCMFFFVPFLTHPPIISYGIGTIPLLVFIGFLLYGIFHFKWLLDNHGRNSAVLFLVILLVTIIVGFLSIWLLVPFPQQV
jgi:hypothetical protein